MGSNRQQGAGTSQERFSEDAGEEVEVAAQISVPNEGGWGWVVVGATTMILGAIDGTAFTYGSILNAVAKDLKISSTLSSLINSLTVFFYYAAGPIVSALINRFGFRECEMFGAILSSFCIFICYFIDSYPLLCILYGVLTGIGLCFMQVSASLIVGHYFVKLRPLALSISFSGCCIGVMMFYPANAFIVTTCSWRTVFLLQAGCLGICYFLAMTYRPLLSLKVVTMVDKQPSKSTVILPSISKLPGLSRATKLTLFNAMSNEDFPTAAQVAAEPNTTTEPMPQTSGLTATKRSESKLILQPMGEVSKVHARQLNTIKSDIIPKAKGLTIDVEKQEPEVKTRKKKKGLCDRCCPWESHVSEQRPMYRDDAFYSGSVKNLPLYKSVTNIPEDEKTNLEYQLAVSRVATVRDLKNNRGLFPESVTRVLATMLDLSLLKRWSFLLTCVNGLLTYMVFIIPFLFAVDRAIANGLNPEISKFLVSGMNVALLVGRLSFGSIANKFDPVQMFIISEVACGVTMVLTNFYFTIWYQFLTLLVYGFFSSALPTLRSMVLVHFYGIEKLTNGTGLKLVFCGVGCSLGGPVVMILNDVIGKSVEFYFGGVVMILAGLSMIAAPKLAKRENARIAHKDIQVKKTTLNLKNEKM